jgi:glycosyltransferase involved in cell wall biosynthesis
MKTIIGIATFNRSKYLKNTVESLKGQADEILVYDNNVEIEDLKDFGKFSFLNRYKEPIYYFTCDDDIIYPKEYVKDTIAAIEQYQSIVTYHSEELIWVDKNQYPQVVWHLFGHEVKSPMVADIMGTGVSAFRTDYFNPLEVMNMGSIKSSDHAASLLAHQQGKTITHIPHSSSYLIDQGVPIEDTMYGKFGRSTPNQIFVANEILRIKNERA